jgi:hypothetical protein
MFNSGKIKFVIIHTAKSMAEKPASGTELVSFFFDAIACNIIAKIIEEMKNNIKFLISKRGVMAQ